MNSAEKGESASENLQLTSFSHKRVNNVRALGHSCIAAVGSMPEGSRSGRGFATALHAHTYRTPFPPVLEDTLQKITSLKKLFPD